MSDPRAQVVLDGDVGPLRQKLREAVQAMQSFGKEAGVGMDAASGPAAALKGHLIGLVSAMSVGAYATFIKAQIDSADAMSKAAQKAGVTTEQYSSMAYAAKLADVEVEQLTKTYAKLNGLLTDAQQGQKEAVEIFRRLKLDPANFKDADELLLTLAERFKSMPDGAAKTALAIDLFGEKLGPGLIPLLNSGKDGLQALREEAERLGVVISTQTGKDAEEFNDTLTRMGEASRGAGMTVMRELLPALQTLASEMLKAKTEGGGTWEFLGKAIRTVIETVLILGANVSYVFKGIGRELGAMAAQIATIFSGEGWVGRFKAISQAVKEDGERARKELDELEKRILGVGKADQPGAPKPTGAAPLPKTPTPEKAPGSLMQYYELALAEDKRLAAERDATREYTKEQELAYWQWLADSTLIHGNDRVAIERKVAQLTTEVRRKGAQDQEAVAAEIARNAEQLELGALESSRAAAAAQVTLGVMTREQFLQTEVDYEARRFEIQRQALRDRIELLAKDPTSSPAARERLNSQLLELEQQYQQRRQNLFTQISEQKNSKFNNVADGFGESFATEFEKTLKKTQSWQQSMANMFRETGDIFIREVITKPLANFIATQAKMLAIKLGFLSQEETAQTLASGKTVAVKATEATSVVTANAAEAASGAAASQASIPYVGWGLALAAMAAVFASVSGLGSRIKSARSGYDIPAGVNPMTQLHEEEMVLPAKFANVIRDMAGGSEPAPREELQPITLQGVSAGDFFVAARRDLVRVLDAAYRDGAIKGVRA